MMIKWCPDMANEIDRERVGNYELLDVIGEGGMGKVYRAVHPEIGRIVAIKVIRPELAGSDAVSARFFDEARAVNAIRHEGIVDIFDLGRRADGSTYYVMEHLVGEDLAHLAHREGPFPAMEAVALLRQVCTALGAAHRRGIIHRDLKPQNLFVVSRGAERRIKILDFGVAKLLHADDRPTTSTGVVLGTIQYMSPEQARGEHVDARADIYSLGCILFELLTGALPFAASNPLAILARLATEDAIAPSQLAYRFGVPPALDEVVLRALAKDRDRRFSDVEELEAALAALDLHALPPPAHRPGEHPTRPVTTASGPDSSAATLPNAVVPVHAAVTPSPVTPAPRGAAPSSVPPVERPDPLAAMQHVALDQSALRLHEAPLPLMDPSTERRVIRLVIPVLLGLIVMAAALLYAPGGGGALDRSVLRSWMPWFAGAIVALCGLLLLVAKTQQSSRGRRAANRALTILSVAIITTSVYLKGSVTSYDILYYPVLVILDRLRENRSLAVFTYVASVLGFGAAVFSSHFDLLPYAPLYPGTVSLRLVQDPSFEVVVWLVMSGITFLSLLLVDVLVSRVQRREAELRRIGLGLAGRVEDQLQMLRRSSDLRRYMPPAVADAILRGEADATRKHGRLRITVVRIDCPLVSGSVEETDPEEFAHLLNELYMRLGDRALEHGGMIDRFGNSGATVLFGAFGEASAEVTARAAIAFARAAHQSVRDLALTCQSAGIPGMPLARTAIHQGFATVGSFGSPTRLEFTAVGPVTEAAALLLEITTPGSTLVTQPIAVSLGADHGLVPVDRPIALPGARHPVNLYTLPPS